MMNAIIKFFIDSLPILFLISLILSSKELYKTIKNYKNKEENENEKNI